MASIEDHSKTIKPRGSLKASTAPGAPWHRRLTALIARNMPKRLFPRTIIIIAAPLVLLQSVVTFVFMERHWSMVTKRLSTMTTHNIAALIDIYQTYPKGRVNNDRLIEIAGKRLNLSVQILPPGDLPRARPKPFFGLLDQVLSSEISKSIGKPFWIDTVGRSDLVEIRIRLDDAIFRVVTRRSQTYASNSHIFLIWMVGASLVLLLVAILFLRNQIRPILRLAEAAENFGKGQPAPAGFVPRGAQEVRDAARSFIKMRDRIERHVDQRTTMLAGVSHDLRTILTRFKLELALAGDNPELEEMRSDVDEMQAMLQDYLAFAKGVGGEEISQVNIRHLLEEVRKDLARVGKDIELDVVFEHSLVPLRRNAFKRAVANLVNNAVGFADHIRLSAQRPEGALKIIVEDNGPGIPVRQREEVFHPFYRLDHARNQNEGSTGLGLSIARDIAHSHGGDITLDESDLGGLKATIRIPV